MTDIQQLHADVIKAAQLAGATYDERSIAGIINAFADRFATMPVELRTTSKPQEKRVVNFRYVQYEVEENVLENAYSAGLVAPDGSSAQRLIADIYAKMPVIGTGVDGGADWGLEKLWVGPGVGPIDRFLGMDAIPDSARRYVDLYQRYGLTKTNIIASDLRNNSMNIYFINDQDMHRDPQLYADLLDELGFSVPDADMLAKIATTPSIVFTYSWDSNEIERFCAYVPTPDLAHAPFDRAPMLETYLNAVPSQTPGRPLAIFGYTYGRHSDYIKLETDYSGTIGLAFQSATTQPSPLYNES